MKVVNISEAKASLSQLLEKALQGEKIIIAKAGKPVARLVPFESDTTPRDLSQGIWQGQVWMADDFDALPPDLMKAFTGESDDDLAP
jgi:prevent-host-death family protein